MFNRFRFPARIRLIDGGGDEGGSGDSGDGGEPKSFTQEQVDQIVEKRLAKERGKYKDYDELKSKAMKLDEMENAGQSAAPSAAASVFAGDDDSDDDSITADTADTTAQGNAILQQILASDLILDYDQPGYYRSVAISFCCTGEDSDFLSMLDDMAANYPSVQLVSFSIDTRSFADTDGSAVTATAFNVSLNVILCDKGGVQP